MVVVDIIALEAHSLSAALAIARASSAAVESEVCEGTDTKTQGVYNYLTGSSRTLHHLFSTYYFL